MSRKVLVVDDEAPIREMLVFVLEQNGFQAIEAEDYDIGCEGFGAQIIDPDVGKKIIRVTEKPNQKLRIVGSRSHQGETLKKFLSQIEEYELKPIGSSLKFCLIAEGLADIYPRYGPTSEWDTAAAQAVVEQAGGMVLKTDGSPLLYNTKDNILNPNFVVINSAKFKELFVKND